MEKLKYDILVIAISAMLLKAHLALDITQY